LWTVTVNPASLGSVGADGKPSGGDGQ